MGIVVALCFHTGISFVGVMDLYSGKFWTSLRGLCFVDSNSGLDLLKVNFNASIGRLTLAAMGGSVMHGDQPLRSSLPLIIDQSALFV